MATTSEIEVTKAYIGLLGRAPDPAGLAYWAAELDAAIAAGEDPVVALKKLTNDITLSDEWDGGIGSYDGDTLAGAESVVTDMYDNLFDRAASQAELDYWAPKIVSGEFTASEMAVALIQGAGATDGDVLGYKQQAATYYVESAGDNHTNASAAASVVDVNGPITLASSKEVTDYVASGVGDSTALTAGADTVAMTAGSDTITATNLTMNATDNITDGSAVDSDTLTITGDEQFDFGTIVKVENIDVDLGKQNGGRFTIDADKLVGGTVDLTVDDTVQIAGVEVTGETQVTMNNLASNLTTTNVTDLIVDLDDDAVTISVDADATTVNVGAIDDGATVITMANESGATLDIDGTTATNDSVSITGTGTVTLDVSAGGGDDVEALTLSGGSNDVTFAVSGVSTAGNMTYTTSGDHAVTISAAAASLTGATYVQGATTALDLTTAGDLDLTGMGVFAGGIDLSADIGNTNSAELTIQSGNTVTVSADQNAGSDLDLTAANDTTADSVDVVLSNDVGEILTTNFETIDISTGSADVVINQLDLDDNDAVATVTGSEDITVTTTSAAGTLTVSGNEVTLTGTTDSTVGGIDIDSTGAMVLTGNVTGTNEVTIDAGGALTVGAGVDNTRGVITLTADSMNITGDVVATAGNVTLTATNDTDLEGITSTAGSITSTGKGFVADASGIAAQNDVTIDHTTQVTIGGNVNTTGGSGLNEISISGNDIDVTGTIGSANTKNITLAASNDASTSNLDGNITATGTVTLSDGTFDATGVTIDAKDIIISGDTDLLGGDVVAESVTITSTNDVTIDGAEETTSGEGIVISAASASGNIDVTLEGSSSGTLTVVTGSGNDTVVLNEGAVANVETGTGADTVTITDISAGSTIDTGAGDDTINDSETVANTIDAGAGDDTYNPVAGSTSAVDMGAGSDTVDAGGLTLSATNITNFEVMDITGGTTISNALLGNDSAFQVTGAATLTIAAPSAAATIDLSDLTFDIAALGNTAINGSTGADTIIGSAAVDVIDAGTGNDTITLGGSADTINYSSGTDGIDTITDFVTGTDKYDSDFQTKAGNIQNSNDAVGTTLASADSNLTLVTATNDLIEIVGTLQSTITDFDNDSQVLDAIVGDGNTLSVSASGDTVLMIVYSGGNAYLYEVDADGDANVDAGEITLVGIFEGITLGGLAPGDFL